MISLRDVEKSYPLAGGRSYVLRRITLDIRQGGFVTIMGPSGAGKSTLLAVLGMLDGAWTGEYFLHEHAVHKLDPKKRVALHKQYVGFVFQQYHLFDDLTVAENLDMPLSYRDIKKSERQAIVADTLVQVLPWKFAGVCAALAAMEPVCYISAAPADRGARQLSIETNSRNESELAAFVKTQLPRIDGVVRAQTMVVPRLVKDVATWRIPRSL